MTAAAPIVKPPFCVSLLSAFASSFVHPKCRFAPRRRRAMRTGPRGDHDLAAPYPTGEAAARKRPARRRAYARGRAEGGARPPAPRAARSGVVIVVVVEEP